MTIEEVEQDISELEAIKRILLKPIENEVHLVFKTYIETETLSRTRKIVDQHNIKKDDGNKYQVNDISKLIASDMQEVDSETKNLAQKILRKNKIKR